MLAAAAGVLVVTPEPPADTEETVAALHARNDRLCAVADELIAVWDGSRGGTLLADPRPDAHPQRVVAVVSVAGPGPRLQLVGPVPGDAQDQPGQALRGWWAIPEQAREVDHHPPLAEQQAPWRCGSVSTAQ